MKQTTREVAIAVRAEMLRQRMKVTDLAKATGIGRVALHHRFNGRVAFDTDELDLVAHALGLPASELIRRAEAAA